MKDIPVFLCSRCRKEHPAIRISHGENGFSKLGSTSLRQARITMELRTRWEMAGERLFSPSMERFDNLILPFEAMEWERPKEYHATMLAEVKALSSYLASKRTDDTWEVPETLISSWNRLSGYSLRCAEGCG